jgi:hypothetical protein
MRKEDEREAYDVCLIRADGWDEVHTRCKLPPPPPFSI